MTLTPAEVDAGAMVRVRAVFVGALPADGTADLAVCRQAVLPAPTDPAVVGAECGGPTSVALDAVGEVVTVVTPDAGDAVWVGDLDGPVPLAGVSPLTVRPAAVPPAP